MKKFLVILSVFTLPVFLVIAITFNANGYTDPFYLRFTSPQQTSLIIGTSRAAQGIVPDVLNNKLNRKDIYNYAFTVAHSPYGEAYYKSIRNKVAETTRNGIFIVAVDPWSISSAKDEAENASGFREMNLAVAKTAYVNISPNLDYLLKSYDKPLVNLFGEQRNQGWLLHDDGWLEVNVPMDSNLVNHKIKNKVAEYRYNHLPVFKPSAIRLHWLLHTINFLKKHGRVFIVRLPVHEKLFEIDNLLMPEFNSKMLEIKRATNAPYLDLTGSNNVYVYTDGNHLYKESSRAVSEKIAGWIKNHKTE